jgi:hypothetical protein
MLIDAQWDGDHVGICVGNHHLLVILDQFSGWQFGQRVWKLDSGDAVGGGAGPVGGA